ncbi:YlxR family protein [Blastococcus sp. Marseille-P5729]|uniref:YlxR family protein n=1 Tax=Blastococcus sp. Marseille-P5729 TaxID=2086582 RepID=UPI001F1E5F3C|nr:YlxR family protein [Blastococcus sp. Marseille-P5729]
MNPRTCIGCRQQADASELIRFVVDAADPGRLRVDPRRRLPGRGAHLHPTVSCLEAATRRRAFTRALRAAAPLRSDELERFICKMDDSMTTTRDPIGDGFR